MTAMRWLSVGLGTTAVLLTALTACHDFGRFEAQPTTSSGGAAATGGSGGEEGGAGGTSSSSMGGGGAGGDGGGPIDVGCGFIDALADAFDDGIVQNAYWVDDDILIGVDGVARITDFGVARAETRLSSTRGGQLKGKVPYMPPEQLMAEPIDRRCDVYATGVVLWEELAGRRLFKADSEGALLQAILSGVKQSPRELVPSVPEALDRACMMALESHPDRRHASAAEMAEALEVAALEAGIPIASSRAVAAFVDSSGAHDKLDAKQLGALKRASGQGDVSLSRGSLPSMGSWPSGASSEGSSPGPPSVPSASSNVTAGAAIVSAPQFSPKRASSRNAVAIGGAIAVVGLVGGFVLARAPTSSVGDSSGAPAMSTTVLADAPLEARVPTPTLPAATVTAKAEPSASQAVAVPSSKAPTPRVVPLPRPPSKTSPKPPSLEPPSRSYNPEKL